MTDDGPVPDQLNLVAADMDATVAFYRRLGLTVDDVEGPWGGHHRTAATPDGVTLDFDSTTFARRWDAGWAGGSGTVIGFRVRSRDEVDRLFEELTGAGYRGQQAPYDAFWGARYAIVEDPDHRPVGIMSPSDPDRRTPPPDPTDW